MSIIQLNALLESLQKIANSPNLQHRCFCIHEVLRIREEIQHIIKDCEKESPLLCKRLSLIKEKIFIQQRQPWIAPDTWYMNPLVLGQAIEILILLQEENANQQSCNPLWKLIHPEIRRVSEKLYCDGSYANAACDAFIEINDRVKNLFRLRKPGEKVPDGDAAMRTVFSVNSPLVAFCDQTTDTGVNIQKGFMEMLAGAMSALRNPKAHANIVISQEDAMRRLVFASMLMYKIDEAELFSGIRRQ